MYRIPLLLLLCCLSAPASAQLTADSLLALSIDYHDPDGHWNTRVHGLEISEGRPGGASRITQLTLFPAGDDFTIEQSRDTNLLVMKLHDGVFEFLLNGEMEIPEGKIRDFKLNEERTLMLRDYYTYLYGLPMKLKDPGTRLRPQVATVTYDGREMLSLTVDYEESVGRDVWTFYFDPVTYALSGYAFYKLASGPGTGEYILLEGEAEVNGMILPKIRHWHHQDTDKYLGSDTILK